MWIPNQKTESNLGAPLRSPIHSKMLVSLTLTVVLCDLDRCTR
jgi:hypothetical protein